MRTLRAPGALANDPVQFTILHGNVEHFLYDRLEPMNLIYEEDRALFKGSQHSRQILGLVQDRRGGYPEIDPQLLGNNAGEGGLAKPGRPGEKEVVQGLPAFSSPPQ